MRNGLTQPTRIGAFIVENGARLGLTEVHICVNLPRCWKSNTTGPQPESVRWKSFLDSLHAKQVKKVLWVLRAVQELPRVPQQYFKKLEGRDDLWEVRAEFGGDAFRLLGFWAGSFVLKFIGRR